MKRPAPVGKPVARVLRSTRAAVIGLVAVGALLGGTGRLSAVENVYLSEVPDYAWWVGCFGTASGNLMGYWDRHGFPDFYTGPTNDGLAPLNSIYPNDGIVALWASQAGVDGRPADWPGHIEDYYRNYESTLPDPYVLAGRFEHEPDCLGDFIGLSQLRWSDLGGECDGNIDGFSFVYWDTKGKRRTDFVPSDSAGLPARDIQSGLRAWTRYRGYDAEVFTQLMDFNPHTPAGEGFTFADFKTEIDAGYPVLLFLQDFNSFSRNLGGMPKANPMIHGMLAYGYYITDGGVSYVRYRTSWASGGENHMKPWGPWDWEAQLPIRGVIGYHPLPRIRKLTLADGNITLNWDGPAARLYFPSEAHTEDLHYYVVERAAALSPESFAPVTDPSTERTATIPQCCDSPSFFRVRLLPR